MMCGNTSLLLSKGSRPSAPYSNRLLTSLWGTQTIKDLSSACSLSIEKAIQVYGSQPELLSLILSSKVEEDRRKAEEAKLRQKEIDYMLHQQQKKKDKPTKPMPMLPHIPQKRGDSIQPLKASTHSTDSTLPPLHIKSSYSSPWNHRTNETTRKTSIDMLLISEHDPDLKLPELSIPSSRSSTNTATSTEDNSQLEYKRPRSYSEGYDPAAGSASSNETNTKRRKREIQAITTIIETKEFPYSDDYLWKNNGNTVHKKTGFKSIYYKCSNGAKGCPVNKTVTFKDNGEYLIKYRGEHLAECHRIKRITDL
ncbi:hypothetical protein CU097_006978 [Rhizopus azygosporus]|uniref:WRKY domain-containing protein n=1 Tax=Rhizopus azygosporus TaxID=86630 RepID=A0A367J621_RHIAZ|nr:hypothetical protein CU097_006978 [Rhizopus azygosporus]